MGGRLFLIRHAQSEANAAGLIETALPGTPLTPLGQEQAAKLPVRLADHGIARVLCSTATRSRQTATPLAAALGLELEVFADLAETVCGELDGRGAEALEIYQAIMHRWLAGERDLKVPGGESWNECRDRAMSVLDGLPPAPWPHDIALVGHAGTNRILLNTLVGDEAAADTGFQVNTGIIELEPLAGSSSPGWRLARVEGIIGNAAEVDQFHQNKKPSRSRIAGGPSTAR